MHFLSGFNDALILIIECKKLGGWLDALNLFDWSDRESIECQITQENLETVKIILLDHGVLDRVFTK